MNSDAKLTNAILNYLIAHEAHHRGQIIMIARQLGYRLPQSVIDGVWKWPTRSREAIFNQKSNHGTVQ